MLGGLEVSALGLGCMGMSSGYGEFDDVQSLATLNGALDRGCTFWDTSDAYGPHANEVLIGQVLATRRSEVVLATKFGLASAPLADGTRRFPRGDGPYVAEACNDSLARLGTDHIDLYYLHRADPDVPIEETVGAMAELVHAGKVRYLGLSECQPETLRRASAVHPITALQSEWSLWTREIESDVLSAARELNIGIVPFSPLGRGALTGAFVAGQTFDAKDMRSRMDRYQGENLAQNLSSVEHLVAMAGDLGCTPAQLALAWVLAQGGDVAPIPGTRKLSRLEENLGALDIQLGTAELNRLGELFPADLITGTRHPAGKPLSSGLTPSDAR
jgi:aryl-alcohol dehydrogenase-like predicted oxidoreductase